MHRRRSHENLDLSVVWTELDLPRSFPAEVEQAAATAADRYADARRDATDVEFVTVDPPGSMDLDQALHLATRPDGGWTVSYAIADVAAFVPAGEPVDDESRRRGETLYLPDGRVPLHPVAISEGAASLLPRQVRPAVLWTMELDDSGAMGRCRVERALVRSRARYEYGELQVMLDAGTAPGAAAALPDVGRARLALARERDAIDLGLPDQEVVRRPDGTWTIEHRTPLPVETWNAQLSLLTGMAAAALMLDGGIGLLRTLPAPSPATIDQLRRAAPPLDVDWPAGDQPGAVIARCDPRRPRHAAFLDRAATLLRGAGYTAFDGSPPAEAGHAGIGGPYAHVTAPIRRLGDRFATEICLALHAGSGPPQWVRDALASLPDALGASGRHARQVERTAIDHVEAWLLADRVGENFEVAVVDHDPERDRSTVVLDDPAVEAPCRGRPALGDRIEARLVEVDLTERRVLFAPI